MNTTLTGILVSRVNRTSAKKNEYQNVKITVTGENGDVEHQLYITDKEMFKNFDIGQLVNVECKVELEYRSYNKYVLTAVSVS